MKERTFLYDDGENFIIWSESDKAVELICVYGDHVYYYVPNKLPDMLLLSDLMTRMNIAENDQNNIRNYIFDLYDDFKLKYKK